MSTNMTAALLAANPGPAAHIALVGAVIAIALIVFAIVRFRHKRDAAEAQRANDTETRRLPQNETHDPTQTPRRPAEGEE